MAHKRATFGEALLRAHRALLEDLRKLRTAARATAEGPPAGLVAALDAVRADTRKHFRFEEENGYLAAVLDVHPHLARTVQRLQGEHAQLLQSLEEIITESRTASALTDELRKKVFDWMDRVRRHERSENVLVQDAFSLDIGAED
jgi:hypothetical protein